MKSRKRIVVSALAVLCLAAICLIFSDRILWSLGNMLVRSEQPRKADMVVVLGGDYLGNRVLKAAELVREGYAPKVLVSGSGAMYGSFEADMAIDYATNHGYPRDSFIALHYHALSTGDEAVADVNQLRKLGVHRYILVTSDYHTSRATRIFKKAGPDLELRTVAAPDPYWAQGYWWKNREGRKLWFYEAVKTVAEYF